MAYYDAKEKADKDHARIRFAREMARKVIKKHKITTPPTPLEDIANKESLRIIYRKWPGSVGGLLLRSQRVIGINDAHHPNRQRFSIAHELGHYFLGHSLEDYETGVTLDNPPTGEEDSSDDIQNKEADEFANELLVPLSIAKEIAKRTKDINILCEMFKVSREVMFISLTRHRLI